MKHLMQNIAQSAVRAASWNWKPFSRLILYGENSGWSLDWDMWELGRIARRLDVRIVDAIWKHAASPQSVFFASQFFLINTDWKRFIRHHIGFSYFHGLPGSKEEEFVSVYDELCKHHEYITRIQVSHSEMKNVVLQTGVAPEKVFLIPIGVNTDFFPFRTVEMKRAARMELGIPESAFVVGSFQKDGVGWGDGIEPKLIKGPDIFLSVLKRVKDKIPELFVLLTGPSRGYVMRGLDELGIPYRHAFFNSYPDVAKMYHALDLYLVASRQEGGPKAILESMATGIPLVTTRVGQAMDLVWHEKNAWMSDVEDIDGLSEGVLRVFGMGHADLQPMLKYGRATAEANSYESQIPMWVDFMKGFVEAA